MSWLSHCPVAALALALAGCGPRQTKIGDTATVTSDGGSQDSGVSTDADGDGYSVAQGDCDDSDAGVHPGAGDKVGDGVDDNCDGIDGIDADQDGYSSEASGGQDCDDNDVAVHPGVAETWYDGVDQDCNGSDDYDADTDGYDADAYGGTDCDDADPSIHPGATEVWYDGVDQDCNGGSDDDADADGYDADGYGGSDCNDADPAVNPGAIDLCGNGVDDDCSGSAADCVLPSTSLSDSSAVYTGEATSNQAGYSVAGPGDVNGDGFNDLLIGDPYRLGGQQIGAAYLVLGSASPASANLADADAVYTGVSWGDQAGYSVSGAGDVDGDGYDDMLFAARFNDDSARDAGAVYLVLGSASPTSASLSDAQARYTGEAASDWAGCAISGAGDINDDGHDDILIGACGNDTAGSGAGATYLVLGSESPASADLASVGVEYTGEATLNYSGWSVSGAGDVDGDGNDDVLIGAPDNGDTAESAGAAYLVLGTAAPSSASLADADAIFTGDAIDGAAGYSVSGAGDVNGDGYADLFIGDPNNDDGDTWAGAAFLVLGSASPVSASLSEADAEYIGEEANDFAGYCVSGAQDVDGDGYDDMLVGASRHLDGSTRPGAAYLVLGGAAPASAELSTVEPRYLGELDAGQAGFSVSGVGDIDGDEAPDLLVGAPSIGRAYLLLTPGP